MKRTTMSRRIRNKSLVVANHTNDPIPLSIDHVFSSRLALACYQKSVRRKYKKLGIKRLKGRALEKVLALCNHIPF